MAISEYAEILECWTFQCSVNPVSEWKKVKGAGISLVLE
jgi:hypothetical protein